MSERFITSTLNRKDEETEKTLRPQNFSAFPGQGKVKERLEVYVSAAKSRNEPLGHLLLSGPPGLGKTTLAYIIANEKGCSIKTSSRSLTLSWPGKAANCCGRSVFSVSSSFRFRVDVMNLSDIVGVFFPFRFAFSWFIMYRTK